MIKRAWVAVAALGLLGAMPAAAEVTWKKTVIDKVFRAEGAAVADVNRDGKLDILAGEFWYEAPDWKPHEITKPGNYGDGAHGYAQCFACWADDINGDGWPDLVVVGFPGAPCFWYENPHNKPGHWKKHLIATSACNEARLYADLFKNGKRVLIIGHAGQLAWFAPGKDPTQPWEKHAISEAPAPGKSIPGTAPFSHGLGVGDLSGDGRLDVLCNGGWWEQPAQLDDKPWKFHPANLGDPCADMFVTDMDGDGKPDVLSSSAHNFGIWCHQYKPGTDHPAFLRHDLFKNLFSQSHAMQFADINSDGLNDLVTGKRWWAHGPKGDPGSDQPAVLYWFEASKSKDKVITFTPHLIDKESGIGTQFWVGDINGDKLPDIAVANKKGVFLFEQVKK